jgi:hypothetical protein
MNTIDIEVQPAEEPVEDGMLGDGGCFICYASPSEDASLEFRHLDCCDVRVCAPCLRQYVEVNARRGRRFLRCPSPACGRGFGLGDVRRLVDAPTAASVERAWYEGDEDATRCHFSPDCDGLVRVEQGVLGLVARCDACAQSSIVAWASPFPRFGDEDPNEAAFRKWASRRMVKACPACGISIEKAGGCNLIVCHCGHRWCWSCSLPAATHSSNLCRVVQAANHPAWGPPTIQVITKPVGLAITISVVVAAAGVCVAIVVPAFIGFGVVAAGTYTYNLVGDKAAAGENEVNFVRA